MYRHCPINCNYTTMIFVVYLIFSVSQISVCRSANIMPKGCPSHVFFPAYSTIPKLPLLIFFPEAICHDSDTIHMKGDSLTNRIVGSMRFIFTVLNTIIPCTVCIAEHEKCGLFCAVWKLESSCKKLFVEYINCEVSFKIKL